MIKDWTYQEAIAKVESIKVIGEQEIYLSKGDFPWHLAISCEPGGSHRLDISTDVWFRATDPITGLNFRWSFEIEPRQANGKGTYYIDVPACLSVMAKLPILVREQFARYLSHCAKAVRTAAKELQNHVIREYGVAASLDEIAAANDSQKEVK